MSIKGIARHEKKRTVGVAGKYADVQWDKSRRNYWLRLNDAIRCNIKPYKEQRVIGKKANGSTLYKGFLARGQWALTTSWDELERHGTRDEMERAAVVALEWYLGFIEVAE